MTPKSNAASIPRRAEKCEACGIMGPGWATIAVLRDGKLAFQWKLCLACASDAGDLVTRFRRERGARRS